MNIEDFISVGEVDDDADFAEPLFQRKYRRPAPQFPHHVAAYLCMPEGASALVCYVHFTDCGDILLGGGACADERVLRRMSPRQRDLLRQSGGVYRHTLQWAVRHFSSRFAAIFGYCGDALAERADRAVGFVSTPHDHLLVYWTREVDERRRRQMIAKAHAFERFEPHIVNQEGRHAASPQTRLPAHLRIRRSQTGDRLVV